MNAVNKFFLMETVLQLLKVVHFLALFGTEKVKDVIY